MSTMERLASDVQLNVNSFTELFITTISETIYVLIIQKSYDLLEMINRLVVDLSVVEWHIYHN